MRHEIDEEKSGEDGERSAGGALKFSVILKEPYAEDFLKACEEDDRDMSSMGRHIIKLYLEERKKQKKYEEFTALQKAKSGRIPHFSGPAPLGLQQDADA